MRRLSILVLAGTATPAAAHSPLPGIAGFYSGLLHPLTTPDQVLALLAAGLLLGTFGLARLAPAAWLLGIGLIVGIAVTAPGSDPNAALYGLACVAACLAALTPGKALPLALAVATVAGVLLGAAAVPDSGPVRDRVITMAGSFAGVALLVLYLAGSVDLLQSRVADPATAISLRVAAAWIAAVATIMLALELRTWSTIPRTAPHSSSASTRPAGLRRTA